MSGDMDQLPVIPETGVQVVMSHHCRQRSVERGVDKNELREALRHGEKSAGYPCPRTGAKRWAFSHGGVTFITDASCTQGITTWPNPCWGIDIETVNITQEMRLEHERAMEKASDPRVWNSHAVAVIDQSGSMRRPDASNGATRSDLAWLCLAVDYVGKRLRSREATSQDYFSLVMLNDAGDILLKKQPFDWILYNRLIGFLRSENPLGAGNYLPAIKTAKSLLLSNKSGSCALQLIFLTDGAPSDQAPRGFYGSRGMVDYHKYAVEKEIAELASRFGSRLTVGGFAVGSGEYSVLSDMMDTAKEYNCRTYFMNASLRVEDLSSAFFSMSTLISNTKTTMTEDGGSRQRTFRDFIREPNSAIDVYIEDEPEWERHVDVYRVVYMRDTGRWESQPTFNHPRARGIVIRDHIFGEGKERAVRRVREVDARGHFIGAPLVGKETLFIEDLENDYEMRKFHKTFCKLQQLAQGYAVSFNKKLLALPGVDVRSTPTIHFLDCYVMLLSDNEQGRCGLLVERMLDHRKYQKWNTNDGYVASTNKLSEEDPPLQTCQRLLCTPGENEDENDYSFTINDIPQAFLTFYIYAVETKVYGLRSSRSSQYERPSACI